MIAKNAPFCQRLKPNNPPPARFQPRATAARAGSQQHPPASPGRRKGAPATIVERRAAATDQACGVAGRADRRSFPWRNARARETTMDQDQPIEIARFRARKTGDNRKDLADRQLFPTSAELRGQGDQHVGSLYVPVKGRNSATRPDYPVGKETWRQAGPIRSRTKSARHPLSERRPGWVGTRHFPTCPECDAQALK
jgi:hypothetical protein